ncbi:MAG: prephenate dehydrogenase/arogenate dehydrogenase family protein [Actinobacteria bacterium]|nr:MAG: prephenate dehydrogenase/arogenate dehydrogenase family protein [Actinomycetota bacterium]
MTSMPTPDPSAERPADRVAIVGTGLIGTSIAMAAARAGCTVRGWDIDPDVAARAAARSGLTACTTVNEAVTGADLVIISTPIGAVARSVSAALRAAPDAVVADAASIKEHVVAEVHAMADPQDLPRYVPSHPLGGSERSGPEHASASVVDGIVWAVTPTDEVEPEAVGRLEGWIGRIGAQPVRLSPERHDRLVAFASHLPQVASTSLMGLAATEEAGEPEILLLAAGGFRDLTRLAASNPSLWSEILVANRDRVASAIDLYVSRLVAIRDEVLEGRGADVERTFDEAKRARLTLATKPTVRAGVAVVQVEIPDEPGALARITAVLGDGRVNIEDLQIVHSPEGGRGTVHLTVAAATAEEASHVLAAGGYDPIRLA